MVFIKNKMLSIALPPKVTLNWGNDFLKVTGPLGSIIKRKGNISLVLKENRLYILGLESDERKHFYLSLLRTLLIGVSKGYRRKLRLVGVGYRASISNKNLILKLGYSHEVVYVIPDDVQIQCSKNKGTLIVLKGKELHRVCQVASEIRSLRVPDSYKGKGIHYDKEELKLKKGKREGK